MSTTQLGSFPDDYINPQEKNEKYWVRVAEAITSRNGGYSSFVNPRADQIRKNRAYSSGRQSIEPYLDTVLGEKKKDGKGQFNRKGYMNVSYDIVSPAPKLKELMLGLLEEIDHDVTVEFIDPLSIDKKLTAKYSQYVKGLMMPTLKKLEQQNGLIAPKQDMVINNPIDLEMYEMIGGFKLNYEIEVEKLIGAVDKESNWDVLARLVRGDLWDNNESCVKPYYDPYTGKIKKRYIDVEKFIIGYNGQREPENIVYAGHYETMTIGDIYQRVKVKDQDEWRNIVRMAQSTPLNSQYSRMDINQLFAKDPIDQRPKFYDLTVEVFCFEYITIDREYKTFRQSKDGIKYHPDTFGEDKTDTKRQTNIVDKRMLYEGVWLCGTQYMVEYGPSPFMVRPRKSTVRVSYCYSQIPGASKVERMIPLLDSFFLSHLKLQNAKAQAAPKGIAIDINAINNINMGDGIQKPLELVKIYRQTGSYVYRSYSLHNKLVHNNTGAITELSGGIGPQLDEWITCMANDLRQIMEITGFTDVSAASPDQSAEMTLGSAQIAMQQTNNSMKMLYESASDIKRESSCIAVAKALRAIYHNEKSAEAYGRIIGKNGIEVLKSVGDTDLDDIGLHMVATPTQHEINSTMQAAMQALNVGRNGSPTLEMSDYFMIERLLKQGRVKQAQAYLTYRSQVNAKRIEEQTQANIQNQSQALMQQDQASTQNKLVIVNAEKDKLVAKVMAEKDRDIAVQQLKNQGQKELLELEASLQERTGMEIRKKL